MKLNNLNLNMLKCFQAVAEKNSLGEGAKSLNLTTSAVYQAIRKLENEIEQNLFFRSGNSYILTDAGRSLQELFQRFLWDLTHFQDGQKNVGVKLEGLIRVGLPLNFSKSVFVPLMKKFLTEYPRVQFHLTVAETGRLTEQVCAFNLDFAITDDAIPRSVESKIVKYEIYKEELVLACSKSFLRKNEATFSSFKTMKELSHLDYAKNFPLIQSWYKLHHKRQVKVNESHIIDNVETMVASLKEGLGLGIIPKSLMQTSDLVSPFEAEVTSNRFFLIQEANYINNTLLKRFLQFMQANL